MISKSQSIFLHLLKKYATKIHKISKDIDLRYDKFYFLFSISVTINFPPSEIYKVYREMYSWKDDYISLKKKNHKS